MATSFASQKITIIWIAEPEDPTIYAKDLSVSYTELQTVQFWHNFA